VFGFVVRLRPEPGWSYAYRILGVQTV
jgi:hypothetical protein